GLPAELLDALFDQLNRRPVIAEDHHPVRCLVQYLGQFVQLGVRLDALRPLGELARDRAVRGADMLALRQVLERFGERPRGRAQPLAQVDHGELHDALPGRLPFLFLLGRLNEPFTIEAAQEIGGALVQVRLGPGELDLGVARPARRQVQVVHHARAPGADHHFVREGAQAFGVTRLAVVARHQVLSFELLPRAELAGPKQGDQVVQLAQIVLQRRGREQQDEVTLDLLDEPVRRAALALHLVIVDEAHKVKSERSATYRFIEKIERDFILLLTATPLQNDLRELYNLITLLRPGQLGTWQEFKTQHLVSGDHRQPSDPEGLRALTHEVMIRTRRSSVVDDLDLPPRRPRHPEVKLTRAEADLYERTTDFLRRLYREGFIQPAQEEEEGKPTRKGVVQLAVIHLRQRLCSSARALAESLEHLAQGEHISPAYRTIARQLAKRAQGIKTHAKLDELTKVLNETPDRVVVFSDHRPTIQLIEERVKKLGRKPIVYWGAHATAERDKRIRAFHEDPRSVLIATRAGSEGRNLQFCNVLVNYDLPWNPMVVEQRIGRLHRIGQKREVHIVNLAAAGTIESYILQLLDRKIKLFELVVGELDLILGEFGGAQQFEGRLAKEWVAAEGEAGLARRVETVGADIEKSSAVGKEQEQLNSLIAPDDNAMRLERRFETLSVPGRLRLGLGTSRLVKGAGWDAKRHRLGVHVTELLEALESIEPIGGVTPPPEPAGRPQYGDLVRLSGRSSSGRAIALVAQVDRLPLFLADIEADAE